MPVVFENELPIDIPIVCCGVLDVLQKQNGT